MQKLGVHGKNCLVVEDSVIGLQVGPYLRCGKTNVYCGKIHMISVHAPGCFGPGEG